MKRLTLCLACALALAVGSTAAAETGRASRSSVLRVRVDGPVTALKPIRIVAAGKDAPLEPGHTYKLHVFAAIGPAGKHPRSCAAEYAAEDKLALTHKQSVADLEPYGVEETRSGPFTVSVRAPFEALSPGDLRVCAYTLSNHIGGGGVQVTSASTEAPIHMGAPYPAPGGPPEVSQTSRKVLNCSRGDWTDGPLSFTYRWQAARESVVPSHWTTITSSGAPVDGSSLQVTHDLSGSVVRCVVTARNSVASRSRASAGIPAPA